MREIFAAWRLSQKAWGLPVRTENSILAMKSPFSDDAAPISSLYARERWREQDQSPRRRDLRSRRLDLPSESLTFLFDQAFLQLLKQWRRRPECLSDRNSRRFPAIDPAVGA
jgi:hypothetical protein